MPLVCWPRNEPACSNITIISVAVLVLMVIVVVVVVIVLLVVVLVVVGVGKDVVVEAVVERAVLAL